MSVTLTPLPAGQATETTVDLLGALLLATIAQSKGAITTQNADSLLAMDLIAKSEELDLALTP